MKWRRNHPKGLLAYTSGDYYIDWTGRFLYYRQSYLGEYPNLKRTKLAAERHKAALAKAKADRKERMRRLHYGKGQA